VPLLSALILYCATKNNFRHPFFQPNCKSNGNADKRERTGQFVPRSVVHFRVCVRCFIIWRFYAQQLVPASTAVTRISYGNSVRLSVRGVTIRCRTKPRFFGSSPYKCTKQQFIHLLTPAFKDLHIKNSKNHKKVILPASH